MKIEIDTEVLAIELFKMGVGANDGEKFDKFFSMVLEDLYEVESQTFKLLKGGN